MTIENKDNPSMQDILADIRGVIAGDNISDSKEDVLELTEIVEQGSKPKNELNDVLDNIDSLFANSSVMTQENLKKEDEPEQKPADAVVDSLLNTLNENKEENIVETPPTTAVEEPKEEPKEESTMESNQPIVDFDNLAKQAPEANVSNEEPEVKKELNDEVDPTKNSQDNNSKTLLSEQAIEETSKHFKDLLRAVSRPQDGFGLRSGVTVEDLVVESLKPQLSIWLEKNLSALVKEIVEKEVRRLIPNDDE
ncbi:MAG: DUF2497 domain-containing protein [Sphingobacteriia bacterium]|nr:DUF2497 domain-containing protein [Sphingobacteriia bacterium]